MNIFNYYVFNATQNRWFDEHGTWGAFSDAREFHTAPEAEETRECMTKDGDATYTMGWAQ